MINTFKAQHFFADYIREAFEDEELPVEVNEWQPCEGEFHSTYPNSVYFYFSDVGIDGNKVSQMDPQQLKPNFNIDIYVSEMATSEDGEILTSNLNAHRTAEGIIQFIYARVMNQTTRDAAEAELGFKLPTLFISATEQVGTVKKVENSRATVGFRLRLQIELEERNNGYVGNLLTAIADTITTQQEV